MAKGYSELANELVSAANGVDYAYRDTGGGEDGLPLVLLQHFRGNLDNWDPALIDALAPARRVVTLDNAGVGGSTGTTPDTIEQMARDAIAFLAASGTDGATSHHRGLARASRVESRHRDASGAGDGGAANRARGAGGRGRVPSRVSSRPRGAALLRVGSGSGRVAPLCWRHAGEGLPLG